MRFDRRFAGFLVLAALAAPACAKKKPKAPAAAAPFAAATPDAPATPVEQTQAAGALAVNFNDTLNLAVKTGLVEKGIDPALADKLSGEVQTSGVLNVDTAGALTMFGLLAASDADLAKANTGAIVAAYVKAAKDDLSPEQTLLLIGTAIHVAAKTAHEAGGLDPMAMATVLDDLTDKTMAAVPQAGLDAPNAAAAAGAAAKAVLEGVVPAGFAVADQPAAAAALAPMIGEKALGADPDAGAVLTAVGEGAAGALATLAPTDPVASVGSLGGGLMAGLIRSSGALDARLAAAGDLPAGLSKGLPGSVADASLGDAVDALTTSSAAALFAGASGASGDQLADAAALIAAAPARGLAASAVSSDLVVGGNLASRSLDALLNGAFADVAALDEAARQRFVFKSFESTVSALARRDDTAFVDAVAANYMGSALGFTAKYPENLGFAPKGTLDEAKLQAFYGGVYTGAFNGLGAISDKSAAVGASILPRFAAQTMSGTIGALKTVAGTGAVSADLLTNLPASAAFSLGQSLATRLPAADLSTGFANATGQYVNDLQGLTASRPGLDFNGLTRNVAGTALATFSGAFNARPTDMQEAAGYLNAKLGSFKLDPAVYSAAQSGTAEVVVGAAKNRNGGALSACANELPDALSDADFDAKMRAHPELVVCTRADASCPKARTLPLVVYDWQPDAFGTQCVSYRRPNVQNSIACDSGYSFVYGAGCLPDRTTCPDGQSFIFGLGCQSSAFYCPAGQVFVAGSACVAAANTTFTCAASERFVPGKGCQTSQIQTCAKGQHLTSGQCAPDDAPVCPGGIVYTAANGCALAATASGSCPAGLFRDKTGACANAACPAGSSFDPASGACRTDGSCSGGQVFDANAKICRVASAASACAATQFLDAATGRCADAGACPGGSYWDPKVGSCRANGACAAGYLWNPSSQSCAAATASQTCAACFDNRPDAPAKLEVVQGVGALALSWSAADTAESYIVLRRKGTAPATTAMVDGQLRYPGDKLGDVSVVFVGPFTSFTDYRVEADETYHYAVGTVNRGATGPLYSAAVARSSATAPAAPTGAPAAAAQFSATGAAGGVQLRWSSSGAGGVLIIRRRLNALDTVSPDASRDYAIGQELGGGAVIYRGNGDALFDAAPDSDAGASYYYALVSYSVLATGPQYSSVTLANAAPAAGGAANANDVDTFSATGGPGVIALAWSAAKNAAVYVVIREAGQRASGSPKSGTIYYPASAMDASKVVCVTERLSCQDANASSTVTYYYTVFASVGGTGGPFYSAGVSASANAQDVGSSAPGAPTGLSVSPTTASIKLTWTGPTAAGYLVVRRADDEPNAAPADGTSYGNQALNASTAVFAVTSTSFTDYNVTASHDYHYLVYAYNSPASGPLYSPASGIRGHVADPNTPDPVTDLRLSVTTSGINAYWKSSVATKFVVLLREARQPDTALGTTLPVADAGTLTTTFVAAAGTVSHSGDDFGLARSVTGLVAGRTYYATVIALAQAGGVNYYSEPRSASAEAGNTGVWRVTDSGTASRFNKIILSHSGTVLGLGRKANQVGTASGDDAFVQLYDATIGSAVWSAPRVIGGNGFDAANDAAESGGDFYVVGNQKSGSEPQWLITLLDGATGAVKRAVTAAGALNGGVAGGEDVALAVAVGAGGRIFVAGFMTQQYTGNISLSGTFRAGMLRSYADNGSALTATAGVNPRPFSDGNTGNDTRVIALRADNSAAPETLYALIASGPLDRPKTSIARFIQSTLATDNTFGTNGFLSFADTDPLRDFALGADGKLYVIGTHYTAGQRPKAFVHSFTAASGGANWTAPLFIPATNLATSEAAETIAQALVVDAGFVYAGVTAPNAATASSGRDYVIAKLNTTEQILETSFHKYADYAGSDDVVRGLAVYNSQLLIGGYVSTTATDVGGSFDLISTGK